MPSKNCMTEKDKEFALELFKAHFTAKEASNYFSFGYATLRNIFRGFEGAKIIKHDRFQLINRRGGNIDRFNKGQIKNVA